jgi:hypothetical protein
LLLSLVAILLLSVLNKAASSNTRRWLPEPKVRYAGNVLLTARGDFFRRVKEK